MLRKYVCLLDPAAAPPAGGAPTASAAPAPAQPAAPANDDPFSGVDAMFEPAAKAPDAPPPDKGKTPDGKPTPPAAPTGDKSAKQPDPGKRVAEPKALREELDRVRGELDGKTKSLASLEAKIKDYEARGKDTEGLVKRAAELEKQIGERDAQIRAYRQEASPEFKAKYDEPFNQRAADAKIEINALQIGEWREDSRLDENGQKVVTGKSWHPVRAAVWEKDFAALFNLPYAEARARAKDVFGEEAGLVMDHYTSLHRLTRERNRALEAEKENAGKREEDDRAKATQAKETFAEACRTAQKDYENKYPDFYSPPADDKEAEKAYQEGWRLLDAKPETFAQAVALITRNRLNAATAPMLQLQNRRLLDKIKTLEERIDKRGKAGPGSVKAPASGGGAGPDGDEDSPEAWKSAAREAMAGIS